MEMERRVELSGLAAEVAAIHRENAKRDEKIEELASDIKELLALANKGRGGFWAGMLMASFLSSIVTWAVSHLKVS